MDLEHPYSAQDRALSAQKQVVVRTGMLSLCSNIEELTYDFDYRITGHSCGMVNILWPNIFW